MHDPAGSSDVAGTSSATPAAAQKRRQRETPRDANRECARAVANERRRSVRQHRSRQETGRANRSVRDTSQSVILARALFIGRLLCTCAPRRRERTDSISTPDDSRFAENPQRRMASPFFERAVSIPPDRSGVLTWRASRRRKQ